MRTKQTVGALGITCALLIAGAAQAQTLTTNPPTTGLSNNFAGIFMDLTANAAGPGLYLNQIDTSLWVTTGTHNVQIWWKTGTYMGFDTNQAAWTQHATFSVTAVPDPANNPISFVLPAPLLLPAGQTIGLYLVMETGGIRYTGGTNPQTLFSNADISLFSERGRSGGLFGGSVFTPRAFAGTIHYQPVPQPGALALLGFAATGLVMRRRRA